MQKSKSYYRALCACLGLLVIGGATAYYGINQVSQKQAPQDKQKPVESAQLPLVEEPLTERVIFDQSQTIEQAKAERTQTNQDVDSDQGNTGAANAPKETPPAAKPKETEPAQPAKNDQTAAADPIFELPLQGEVVMDYSMEHAIFDPTLEQFRTNNCISIAAKEGDTVTASADGTVANVVEQVERGITVVINHNNGWETTYSQLQGDVLVKKGDQVKKGQDIGEVGKTTKYGAALGDHLDFAVIKDGQYVDPKGALAQ